MRLGRAKEVGRGQILKSSYWWGGGNFYGMELTPLDIRFTIFSLVIVLLLTDDVNHSMHLFLTCTYSQQFQTFFSISLKNLKVLLKALLPHTDSKN